MYKLMLSLNNSATARLRSATQSDAFCPFGFHSQMSWAGGWIGSPSWQEGMVREEGTVGLSDAWLI